MALAVAYTGARRARELARAATVSGLAARSFSRRRRRRPRRVRAPSTRACRLRRKLDAAGARHLIVNRRGVGYALTTPNHNGNANGDGGRAA